MTIARGQHLIGRTLGSCVLERLLGYGGSSAVFLAREEQPERDVAVKVFLPRAGKGSREYNAFYRRFLREAKAASALAHPNILPIYSYGEQDGLPYIVMPYVPGGTLSQYIAGRGPLSLLEAQWYLEQLAAALDYAHQHGCVHCDVKPANMLLNSEGRVLLSDFGIAHLLETAEGAEITQVRDVEPVFGTPDYISPEQALGRTLDGRSDVYSLAVTLFFLLAKQLPFTADSMIALALQHVHEAPPSLALLRADVTPALDRVMHKALAKDPEERYQTASAFCAAFIAAAAAGNRAENAGSVHEEEAMKRQAPFIAAQPIVRVKPIVSSHTQRMRTALLIMACLVLLVTLLLLFWYAARGLASTAHRPVAPAGATPGQHVVVDQLTHEDNWPQSGTFFFSDKPQSSHSYHVVNKSASNAALAPYYNHVYQNFRLQVTMEEVQQSSGALDYYGIFFRASDDEAHYYLFEISPHNEKRYLLTRYDGGMVTTLQSGIEPALRDGTGQTNTLQVEARDRNFSLSLNGKSVLNAVNDSSPHPLLKGQVGLYVEDQDCEVAFSHLSIESLP